MILKLDPPLQNGTRDIIFQQQPSMTDFLTPVSIHIIIKHINILNMSENFHMSKPWLVFWFTILIFLIGYFLKFPRDIVFFSTLATFLLLLLS